LLVFFPGLATKGYLSERLQVRQGALLGVESDATMRAGLQPGRSGKTILNSRRATKRSENIWSCPPTGMRKALFFFCKRASKSRRHLISPVRAA
jgi:hypothetical protein